jgi:hypothetical protein
MNVKELETFVLKEITEIKSTVSDYAVHKAKLIMVETSVEKLAMQIERVDNKSEARHEKVMAALNDGMIDIKKSIDEKGSTRWAMITTGIIVVVSVINVLSTVVAHIHWS